MQGAQESVSPIPRILLRSPRKVRRKPGTLRFILLGRILTAPVPPLALALLVFVLVEPLVVFLLPAQPARIVAHWCDAKARRGIEYYVEYQVDRTGFTSHDQVLQDEYRALAVGQAVKAHVIHLGQAGYSALDRSVRTYVRYRMILWFGALFAVPIGWILFYATWLGPWRSQRLAQQGKATFGAVVAKNFVGGHRHLSFTLTYQFRASGTLHAHRIRISSQRYDSTCLEDLVIVLFDPQRPQRNIVYDYCDFVAM